MAIKKIVWLGHASFLFYLENSVVALDPWFTGNPSFPQNFKIPKIDFVLLSHGHQDHTGDVGFIMSQNKNAKLVAQFELALLFENVLKLSKEQVISVNVGGHIKIDEIDVKMVNAIHTSSVMLDNQMVSTSSAMGFVISDLKNSIYYAGDTSLTYDMKIIGDMYNITYAMLPIGGTYTMDYSEVPYAMRLINTKNLIPMHYNTFPAISVNMDDFKLMCEKNHINAHILNAGEDFCIL